MTEPTTGKAIPSAKADDDGQDAERSTLERRAIREIRAALATQLQAALPEGTTEQTVAGAETRALLAATPLRDALYSALVDGAMLGTARGKADTEAAQGIKAEITLADWELINSEARAWASDYAGTLVQGINETTLTALRRAIAEWIGNTLTYQQLLAELAGVFGPDRAKRIAETEITRAYAEGSIRAWRAGGIITEMEWRTAADERVCSQCGPLNGQVMSVTEGFSPNPPAHPRCRCWVVGSVSRG